MYTTPYYPTNSTSFALPGFISQQAYLYHQSTTDTLDLETREMLNPICMSGTEADGIFDYEEDVSDMQVLLNALESKMNNQ